MRIVVGCPVRQRNLYLPFWRQHLEIAVDEAQARFGPIQLDYQFVVGADDLETIALLSSWQAPFLAVVEPEHDDLVMDQGKLIPNRDWLTGPPEIATRLVHMVELRNELLGRVRAKNPDFFLSLDSDMFLHPDALYGLLDCYEAHKPYGCWAVGGSTYMSAVGTDVPSYGIWRDRSQHQMGMSRSKYEDMKPVDIIMGIKLMDRRAYEVDYRFHTHGEDLGWSEAIGEAGGKLWWDGRTVSKHCFNREMLDLVDERYGY